MTPEFDEVLLTAYLDDEVTEAERAMVEAELSKSEAARKLLEELRTIRTQVALLAQARPSSDWKNGPWNATSDAQFVALRPETSDVSSQTNWKVIAQRLASLAALIAIVVCGSVLWMSPNSTPMGKLDVNDTAKKDQESLVSEPQLKKKEAAPAESGQAEMLGRNQVEEIRLERSETAETGSTLNSGSGDLAMKSKEDSSLKMEAKKSPEDAAGNLPMAAPAMKQRSATLSESMSGQRGMGAGGLAGGTSPAFPKAALSEPTDPSLVTLFDSYASEIETDKAKPVSIEGFERMETLGQKVANDVGRNAHFVWSFQRPSADAKELASVNDTVDGPAQQKSALRDPVAVLMDHVRPDEVKSDSLPASVLPSVVVEFRIPIEDWDAGATRLRQLGVGVPSDPPREDVLEFEAARPVASQAESSVASLPGNEPPRSAARKSKSANAEGMKRGSEPFSFLPITPALADKEADAKHAAVDEQRVIKVLIRMTK